MAAMEDTKKPNLSIDEWQASDICMSLRCLEGFGIQFVFWVWAPERPPASEAKVLEECRSAARPG